MSFVDTLTRIVRPRKFKHAGDDKFRPKLNSLLLLRYLQRYGVPEPTIYNYGVHKCLTAEFQFDGYTIRYYLDATKSWWLWYGNICVIPNTFAVKNTYLYKKIDKLLRAKLYVED